MTLFEEWRDLIENQTEDTFPEFWKEYSEAETKIYSDILDRPEVEIEPEKLFYNMLAADAEYLYGLPQWETILGEEKMTQIAKEYKRSKTIVKGKKIGRNEPCPCGSGKKYKHCCGKTASRN